MAPTSSSPGTGNGERGTGSEVGNESVTPAVPRSLFPVPKDEGAAEVRLSPEAALAYMKVRRAESSPTAAESWRDSSARAEREGAQVRVTWERGEAAHQAREHALRQSREAQGDHLVRLERLHAEVRKEDEALQALEELHSMGKLDAAGLSAARRASDSLRRSLRVRIADEERRSSTTVDLRPDPAPEGGMHLLPTEGPVTLTID